MQTNIYVVRTIYFSAYSDTSLSKCLLAFTSESDLAKVYKCVNMDDYSSSFWYSCQFPGKMIFQVKEMSTESRILTVDPKTYTFTVRKRADAVIKRASQLCMTNYKDKSCFVIGGWDRGVTLKSVSRFNIQSAKWEPITPSL